MSLGYEPLTSQQNWIKNTTKSSALKLYNFNFILSHVSCNVQMQPESEIENNQKCNSDLCALAEITAFRAVYKPDL